MTELLWRYFHEAPSTALERVSEETLKETEAREASGHGPMSRVLF